MSHDDAEGTIIADDQFRLTAPFLDRLARQVLTARDVTVCYGGPQGPDAEAPGVWGWRVSVHCGQADHQLELRPGDFIVVGHNGEERLCAYCRSTIQPYDSGVRVHPETGHVFCSRSCYLEAHPPVISAEAHSDDHRVEVDFDATGWFTQASDREILALGNAGWGYYTEADDVAHWAATRDPEMAKLFTYLAIGDVGFECVIDIVEAENWVRAHRPALADRMDIA